MKGTIAILLAAAMFSVGCKGDDEEKIRQTSRTKAAVTSSNSETGKVPKPLRFTKIIGKTFVETKEGRKRVLDEQVFDSVLAKLYSKTVKGSLAAHVVEKGFTTNSKYVSMAIDFYEQQDKLSSAINIAEKLNLKPRVRELYHKLTAACIKKHDARYDRGGCSLEHCAEYAEKSGDKEQSNKLYKAAIEDNKKYGSLFSLSAAARIANKLGDKKLAKDLDYQVLRLLEERELFDSAARLAKNLGDTKLADIYKSVDYFLKTK